MTFRRCVTPRIASRRGFTLATLILLLACESSSVEVEENQDTPGAQGDAVASLVLVGGAGRMRQARFGFNRVGLLAGEVDASLKEGVLTVDLAALPPAGEVIVERVKLTGRTSYVALSLGLAAACVEFEDPSGEVHVLTSAPAFGDCGPSTGALRFDVGTLTLPFPEGQRFEPSQSSRVLLEIDASEAVHFDEAIQAWRFDPTFRSLPETAAAEFVVHMTVAPGTERVAGDFDVFLVSERSTFRARGRPDTAGRLIFGRVSPGLYAAHVRSPEGRRLQVDGLVPEVLRQGAPESSDLVVGEIDDGIRVVTSGLAFISGNRTGAESITLATALPEFDVAAGQTLTVSLREVGRPESGCPGGDGCLTLVWDGEPSLPNRLLTPATGLVLSLSAGDGLLSGGAEVAGATPVELGEEGREWSVVLTEPFPRSGEIGLELSIANPGGAIRLLAWEIRVGPT